MKDKELLKKTEDILYKYRDLNSEIKSLELKIRYVEIEDFNGVSAINYENCSKKSNNFNSYLETEVIKKEQVLLKLKKELSSKKILKELIDSSLNVLNENEKNLIKLRYMKRDRIGWDQIGYELKFSPDYCRQKLRYKAIKKIANTIFIN